MENLSSTNWSIRKRWKHDKNVGSVISSLTQHSFLSLSLPPLVPPFSFALFSYSVRVWNIEKSRKNSGKIVRIRKPRRLRGSERISEKPCAPVTQTRVKKDDTGGGGERRRSKRGALMAHSHLRRRSHGSDGFELLLVRFILYLSSFEFETREKSSLTIFAFSDVFWFFSFDRFHDYSYHDFCSIFFWKRWIIIIDHIFLQLFVFDKL